MVFSFMLYFFASNFLIASFNLPQHFALSSSLETVSRGKWCVSHYHNAVQLFSLTFKHTVLRHLFLLFTVSQECMSADIWNLFKCPILLSSAFSSYKLIDGLSLNIFVVGWSSLAIVFSNVFVRKRRSKVETKIVEILDVQC